jgi:nitrite reductase/ring-hydroxylating ferredoxin subunit
MPDAREAFDTGLLLEGLDPERPLPIDTPWGSISLFVRGGEVFAVQSFCPHLEGPLFQGTLSGEEVTCPWHGWRFSLRSGRRVDLGAILPGAAHTLLCCDVKVGPRRTLLLSNPRRAR